MPDWRLLTARFEYTGTPERDAVGLLRTAWAPEYPDIKIPVDPTRIAGALGIKVLASKLAEGVSGVVRKKPGADPVIYLSGGDSDDRQRFSCALALGHYVARTTSGDDSWEYMEISDPSASRDASTAEEYYANAFAAELCMPTDAVVRLMNEHVSVVEMAPRFGVPLPVMRNRVLEFGR